MAASFASAPLWQKNDRPPKPSREIASAASVCGSEWNRLPTCHSRCACSVTASTRSG